MDISEPLPSHLMLYKPINMWHQPRSLYISTDCSGLRRNTNLYFPLVSNQKQCWTQIQLLTDSICVFDSPLFWVIIFI